MTKSSCAKCQSLNVVQGDNEDIHTHTHTLIYCLELEILVKYWHKMLIKSFDFGNNKNTLNLGSNQLSVPLQCRQQFKSTVQRTWLLRNCSKSRGETIGAIVVDTRTHFNGRRRMFLTYLNDNSICMSRKHCLIYDAPGYQYVLVFCFNQASCCFVLNRLQ